MSCVQWVEMETETFCFLSLSPGLSKIHFDVQVFLLKFVHVKYIWVQVGAHEVFETVKLLLVSL